MIMLWIIILSCYSVAANVDNWAGCSEDQKNRCKHAVEGDEMLSLENYGDCEPRTYASFTHTCTVKRYRTGLDYCCCQAEIPTQALCCRYHDIHERFRCDEVEDSIKIASSNLPPLRILLPAVLGPIVILICCIGCCVKCCCYGDDGDEGYSWLYKCWFRRSSHCDKHNTEIAIGPGGVIAFPNLQMGPESQPLTSQVTPPQEKRKQPPEIRNVVIRPSAPPAEDMDAMYRQHPPGGCPLRSNGGGCGDTCNGNNGEHMYAVLSDTNCIHGPTTHLHHPSNTIPAYGRLPSNIDSNESTNSSDSPPPMTPIVSGGLSPQYQQQKSGGGASQQGDCSSTLCPNCSAGKCAPPAYEESLCHPIMPE